jgi:hypothetical protein
MPGNQTNEQKIPHGLVVRASGHRPMFYKTWELAEDLGNDQLRIVGPSLLKLLH